MELRREPGIDSLTLRFAVRDAELVQRHLEVLLQAWPLQEGIRTESAVAYADESPEGDEGGAKPFPPAKRVLH